MKNRKIIKVEIPQVIWDAEMSICNLIFSRPILRTWMESVQEVISKVNEVNGLKKQHGI